MTVFAKFEMLSMSDLKKILKSMKNVGGGCSGISKGVLCDVCYVAGNRLLDIINASLSGGKFPDGWKESMVVPVAKVSGSDKCNDFRPINNVETYEKVLEIAVKMQLQEHCNVNNILVANQSGFR